MNKKTFALVAAAIGIGSVGVAALAAPPAKTIEARQGNFKLIGKSFKGIMDQMKSPTPDMAAVKANAAALNGAAGKVAGFFPKGTGPESGVKTHALPAIWEKNADFKAAAVKLVAASKGMQAAANSGDINQVKAAFPALGGACKGCHDQFKARD